MDVTSYMLGKKSAGSGGTSDYSELTNKPSINNVQLSGNKSSSELGLSDIIQFSTMPTASADNLGKIVQFVGTTTNDYTNGYFYKCVEDSNVYSWENVNVQNASGGASYTAGDGIEIDNNNIISTMIDLSGTWYVSNSSKNVTLNLDTDAINKLKGIADAYYAKETSLDYMFKVHYTSTNRQNFRGMNAFADFVINFYLTKATDKVYFYIELDINRYGSSNLSAGVCKYFTYYYNVQYTVSTRAFNSTATTIYIYGFDDSIPYSDTSNYKNRFKLFLPTDNTTSYTPTSDYHPATKKYVDDQVGSINTILATLTTPSNNGGNS